MTYNLKGKKKKKRTRINLDVQKWWSGSIRNDKQMWQTIRPPLKITFWRFFDNNYSHSPCNAKQGQVWLSTVYEWVTWNLQTEEWVKGMQEVYNRGCLRRIEALCLKQGSAVNGMKLERACLHPQTHSLGGCVGNAKKGQSRDRLFYRFQPRCRSVCHFFKEVSQDHSSR